MPKLTQKTNFRSGSGGWARIATFFCCCILSSPVFSQDLLSDFEYKVIATQAASEDLEMRKEAQKKVSKIFIMKDRSKNRPREVWKVTAQGLIDEDRIIRCNYGNNIKRYFASNRNRNEHYSQKEDLGEEISELMVENLRSVLKKSDVRSQEIAIDILLLFDYSKDIEKMLREAEETMPVERIKLKITESLREFADQ